MSNGDDGKQKEGTASPTSIGAPQNNNGEPYPEEIES